MNGQLPPELDCLVSVDEDREKFYSKRTLKSLYFYDEYRINYELLEVFVDWLIFEAPKQNMCRESGAILIFLPGWFEIKNMCQMLSGNPKMSDSNKFWILPLHSTLPVQQQKKVFRVPPKGVRKIVISTNVAETGITIPDVVYVIDSGKSKEIRHEAGKRLTKLEEAFISQDNVKQRKGRAGRVQSGYCFHLYTNYRFTNKVST